MNKNTLSSEQKKDYAKIIRNLQSIFSRRECMAKDSDCSSEIISSHTISCSRYLRNIAENNHVLQRKPDLWSMSAERTSPLKSVGVNDASTFNGFCGHHDNVLFGEIDDCDFNAASSQIFAQVYRTHARELYCKHSQITAFPKPKDIAAFHRMDNPESYEPSFESMLQMVGMDAGLRDTLIHYNKLRGILRDREFWRLRSCIIPLEGVPIMACAGAFFPDYSIDGEILQNFSDLENILETIHFNVLPAQTVTYAILSFIDEETRAPEAFINSLISQKNLEDKVVQLSLLYVENTQVRPSWWNNLDKETTQTLDELFYTNINPFQPASPPKYPDLNLTNLNAGTPFWI